MAPDRTTTTSDHTSGGVSPLEPSVFFGPGDGSAAEFRRATLLAVGLFPVQFVTPLVLGVFVTGPARAAFLPSAFATLALAALVYRAGGRLSHVATNGRDRRGSRYYLSAVAAAVLGVASLSVVMTPAGAAVFTFGVVPPIWAVYTAWLGLTYLRLR